MVFSIAFWRAAGERAVKSFAYSLIGTLVGGAVDIVSMPWWSATRIAAGVAVISVLGSVASSAATGGGPSLTNAETIDPAPEASANDIIAAARETPMGD